MQPGKLEKRLMVMQARMESASVTEREYVDAVFAPVDCDNTMERVGGGFETEVYSTANRRLLLKLKSGPGGKRESVLARARQMRAVAERFAACLGPAHTIPNDYLLSRDSAGQARVLVVQPFVEHGRPLKDVDFTMLAPDERRWVAAQLREIIRRQVALYHAVGYMPDLYGLSTQSRTDRARLSAPYLLFWHVWNFLFGRNLLSSHNLLLTDPPDRRVVLVDYDLVPWPPLIRRIYFGVRRMLCWRDEWLIDRMEQRGPL